MTINITIFVQIINFFIAYYIISRLLLKPAIQLIKEDEMQEKELLQVISMKEKIVKEREYRKIDLWNLSLKQFNEQKPTLEKKKISYDWKTPGAKNISPEEKNKLKEDVLSFLIKTVKNV